MIVKTAAQYLEVKEKLLKDGLFAIDTETEEFTDKKTHAFELDLDGVGVYSENVKAYIPSKFLSKDFQELFDKCELIFHNAKFDITIFERKGFNLENIKFHDTMIMAWLLNENRHSFGLKNLAESVLKIKKEKIVEFRSVKKRPILEEYGMLTEDFPADLEAWEDELGRYCISDCKYTYNLYKKFKPKLEEQDLWNVYLNLEIPTVQVLRTMENRGIALDLNYLIEMGKKLDSRLIELQADIWKLVGKDIDINSPKQLAEYFDTLGYYGPKDNRKTLDILFTKKEGLATDEKALVYFTLEYKSEVAKKILEYREFFKLNSTYVQGMLARHKNGVIHGSFLQHGTVTGRLSSRNPNMQNIGRRSDEFDIRKAFVARPGYTFVISDLSQIELRLATHFSQDPTLLKAYQEGKDVHQETADALSLGCASMCHKCNECKEGRVMSKTVNFGILYGRTAFGLSKGLGMNPDDAQKFIDSYFSKFKKIKMFIQQAENTLENKYAVTTITKRKRRFQNYVQAKKDRDYRLVGHIKRQATNSVIQGSAADIVKIQMRNLHKILKDYDAHILLQIHDELLIECPKEKSEKVMEIVKYEMENAIKLKGVPIITEPHVSDRWCK